MHVSALFYSEADLGVQKLLAFIYSSKMFAFALICERERDRV